MMKQTLSLATLAWALSLAPSSSSAAENFANCIGFIDSVPAVISTQGVWCLRADLSTAIASGSAIEVTTNNVTIDCNDFKLGGLAAGPTSQALGIYASNRRNVTVRNCAVRGFLWGIALLDSGTGGHLVEHNRLDGILQIGINLQGDGTSTVRNNRVLDTGGAGVPFLHIGIRAGGHVLDNTVDGVVSTADDQGVRGILIPNLGEGFEVRGNRVRNLSAHGTGTVHAISVSAPGSHVFDNHVAGDSVNPVHYGIVRFGAVDHFSGGNRVSGFVTPYLGNTIGGPDHSN